MKKLFAIFIATVLVAASLFTFVSAEDNTVVYDLMADFKVKEINPAWSFGTIGEEQYTHRYWVEGADPGSGEPVNGFSPFGTLGGIPVCIVTAGDNLDKLTWCSYTSTSIMYIMFTAPADGNYALDFATNRMWAAGLYTPSRYFVKVNDGTPAEGFDVTTSSVDTVSFRSTYSLKEGDIIYIGYDAVENDGAGDNSYITSCKITYSSSASQTPVTPVVPPLSDGFVAVLALTAVAGIVLVISKKKR